MKPSDGTPIRAVDLIRVGERHRKDLGDIASLARSIDARGLLHPIVITPQNDLIAGGRRLAAWALSKFAGEPIPVHVVDIDAIAAGEWDENAHRKDFTPSEAVSIKQRLEAALAPAARERQRRHGGTAPGRKSEHKHLGQIAPSVAAASGKTGDQVARFTGKSRRTLEKAEKIVEAAREHPQKFGKLQADMDRTGRVDGPYKRLQVIRQADELRAAPPPLPMRGPYQCIVIDFPWPHEPGMEQEEIDAHGRSLRPYPAMSIKSGAHFLRDKVAPILAAHCTCWFWTTNFHFPYAFHLLQALGFRRHSTIGTWRKTRMGRGRILRDKTEHCIVALKGSPVIHLTNETTDWSGWPQRENSRKPDEFYAMVEKLCPAPRYADLFSRGGRGDRWDCHGDQVGRFAVSSEMASDAKRGVVDAQDLRPDPPTPPVYVPDDLAIPPLLQRASGIGR